jgi:hypothetical protein
MKLGLQVQLCLHIEVLDAMTRIVALNCRVSQGLYMLHIHTDLHLKDRCHDLYIEYKHI